MNSLTTLPKPSPALGISFYQKNFQDRISFSQAAFSNYKLFEKSPKKEIAPKYRPFKIDIEPVSRCNFACQMCVVSTWDKGKRSSDLAFEHFIQILENEPQVIEIKLQGLGEPLMMGDDLFRMIKFARDQHIWVRTTTNASLLHKNNYIDKILDSGICEIQISIDGASNDSFEAIRKGSKSKVVFENCVNLNKKANEIGWNCTKMWTVVQKDNINELELLVAKSAELGFKSQCFSIDLHGWGTSEWTSINEGLTVQKDELSFERLTKLIDIGRSKGIKVEFWQNSTKYSTSKPETLCPWPFERIMISADMRVTPCCMISNPDTLEIGTGYNSESWTSTTYQAFRQQHLSGNIPNECAMCYEKASK